MSEQNIDDLLAQLKEESEPSSQARLNRDRAAKKSPPPQSASKTSIAQLLDELSKEIKSGRLRPDRETQHSTVPKQEVRNSARERDLLNASIDADYQKQAQKREAKLEELKRKQEAIIAEQKRRERELIEAQKREELRERRRQEALREKAQQWLKSLDRRSEEGKWFEEFSYSYEDKLQAAIDYLEAMRETGL